MISCSMIQLLIGAVWLWMTNASQPRTDSVEADEDLAVGEVVRRGGRGLDAERRRRPPRPAPGRPARRRASASSRPWSCHHRVTSRQSAWPARSAVLLGIRPRPPRARLGRGTRTPALDPALDVALAGAGHRHRPRRDVVGDDRTGRGVGAVADGHRRDEHGVAADLRRGRRPRCWCLLDAVVVDEDARRRRCWSPRRSSASPT